MRCALLVAMLVWMGIFPAAAQVPDDKLVIPGQRIGKWTLGMTLEDLTNMNGRPTIRSTPLIDTVEVLRAYYWGISQGAFIALSADGRRVSHICITGGQFRTEQGVEYRTPASEVVRVYGKPTAQTRSNSESDRMIYDELGLAVSIGSEAGIQVVIWLCVFPRGKAREIWKF